MQTRVLGKDLTVSAVGLGCMGMTHAFGKPSDVGEMTRLLQDAVDLGCTFFDTAECYTGKFENGEKAYNEELVGNALRPYRDKVIIASKFGVKHLKIGLKMDSSPAAIRKAIEGSLRRLNTDYIDLYYQHRIDPKVSPEEVAGVMAELIKEGKIRYWGISEANEEYLRRAHNVCPVTAVQNRLSMMFRDYEALFPVLEELNIGFVAFSPLANGVLTDCYDKTSKFPLGTDYRSIMPQFRPRAFDKNKELFELLRKTAEEKNATPAQISLAWMMAKKPYIVPIPGTRKLSRLSENLGAAEISITPEESAQIDSLLNQIPMSSVFGGKN